MLKKTLLTISIFLMTTSVLVFAAAPTPLTSSADPTDIEPPIRFKNLEEVIKFFTGIIFPLTALGLLAALIVAGFTRMTAAGDAEKEKKSMKIITSAIIGFVIIALAGVIVNSMCALLGIACFP